MSTNEFKPGDKVYHKSDSSTIWVIEYIEKEEAFCSTLNLQTKAKQKESFPLVTIVKINSKGNGGIIIGNSRNKHKLFNS